MIVSRRNLAQMLPHQIGQQAMAFFLTLSNRKPAVAKPPFASFLRHRNPTAAAAAAAAAAATTTEETNAPASRAFRSSGQLPPKSCLERQDAASPSRLW